VRPVRWGRFGLSPALSCRQVVELVTRYLDDALPAHERRRFEEHLTGCADCTEYLAQIRTTIALTGRSESAALDPAARETLMGLYREWQQSER
jgi:anti-sigma factor RsiW